MSYAVSDYIIIHKIKSKNLPNKIKDTFYFLEMFLSYYFFFKIFMPMLSYYGPSYFEELTSSLFIIRE